MLTGLSLSASLDS